MAKFSAAPKEPPKRHPLGESLTGGEREVDDFLRLTEEVAREAEREFEELADSAERQRGAHAAR